VNLTPEQIAAAHKSNLETLSGLTKLALQSIEKLVELNMQITKQTLSDSMSNTRKALEVKDIQQLLAHQAETVMPIAEKIMAYSQHLYQLVHETQASFTKSAEKELQVGQIKINSLVEEWTKNAPMAPESTMNAIKQAIASATNVYEISQKANQYAAQVTQNSLQSKSHEMKQATNKSKQKE